MNKYIDADKLVAEIKRQKKSIENATGDYAEGRRLELENLHKLITSLQQEQTVVGFEDKFANFIERKDAELGANSWSEEDLRELAEYFYFNNKQPEVDLDKFDKEVTKIWGKCAAEPKDSITCFHIETFNEIARQFYELGLKARNK